MTTQRLLKHVLVKHVSDHVLGRMLEHVITHLPGRHMLQHFAGHLPRVCFQSVVILIENVVKFSCGPKAHHLNSIQKLIVRCC